MNTQTNLDPLTDAGMFDFPPPVHMRDYVIKGAAALVAVASLLFAGRVVALAIKDLHNPRGIDVPYRSNPTTC